MIVRLGPSKAARQKPDHLISIAPANETWVAKLGNVELARSDKALLLSEDGYPTVVYFPPEDVKTDDLVASDSQTHCPYKGDACYWAADVGSEMTDIAWYYPRTFDEVVAIAGHVAFYANLVAVSRAPQASD